MSVDGGLRAGLRDRVVDAEQVLGCGYARHRTDLRDYGSSVARRALRTKCKKPELAFDAGSETGRTRRRLRLCQGRERLQLPIQRPIGDLCDLLLHHRCNIERGWG